MGIARDGLSLMAIKMDDMLFIASRVQQYQANPANQWRAKDTAITLIIALALRSSAISVRPPPLS